MPHRLEGGLLVGAAATFYRLTTTYVDCVPANKVATLGIVDLRPETPDTSVREAIGSAGTVKAVQGLDELERRMAELRQIERVRDASPDDLEELQRAQEVQRVARRHAAEINRIADQHRMATSIGGRRLTLPAPAQVPQAAAVPEVPVTALRQVRGPKRAAVSRPVETVEPRPRVQASAEQVRPIAPPPSGYEVIAARQGREARNGVIRFLRMAGLAGDIEDLTELEKRLHRRNQRDLQHAAFCSRMILASVADRVFPACAEPWRDLHGKERPVGPEEVGNRLSAFLDKYLRLEPAIRAAFQGELDALKRWAGRGPHGIHTAAEADRCYMRLLSVLAVVTEAFDAAIVPIQAPRLSQTA